jgi:hypothetical protein
MTRKAIDGDGQTRLRRILEEEIGLRIVIEKGRETSQKLHEQRVEG